MSNTASTPQGQPAVAAARAELKRHFNNYQGTKYAEGWASLWTKGDFLPWDRGGPSPALADTLINHADVVGHAIIDEAGQTRRKRALVPGCGRGVDVLLLQSFGYDVVGLEYADDAVKACLQYEKEHAAEYPVQDEKTGKGSARFIQGDFYSDDWVESAGFGKGAKFDLIYDYTVSALVFSCPGRKTMTMLFVCRDTHVAFAHTAQFFCAMDPSMRPAWAQRMCDLLRHSAQANLVCLEFPVSKPPKVGGPPYGAPSKAYLEHLSHPGEDIPYDAEANVRANPLAPSSSGGLERAGHWQPADTHKVGKDADGKVEDWIAVWRHR